jgi:exonuclease III
MKEIFDLCDSHDFVMLQEHWLLPNELDILGNIHPDMYAVGNSAVDLSAGTLVGRPYGGTAILYKKHLASCVSLVETGDPRICAVNFISNVGPVLLVCVYMPTDRGDAESFDQYLETCSRVHALYSECDAVECVIAGDFNCQIGSRFYDMFSQLATDNNLVCSDLSRLSTANTFTYCGECTGVGTWIDHVLCSTKIDGLVVDVKVLYDFITSDHVPLVLQICGLSGVNDVILETIYKAGSNDLMLEHRAVPDWKTANASHIENYKNHLDEALKKINIPIELLDNVFDVNDISDEVLATICSYYECIVSCVRDASSSVLPLRRFVNVHDEYVIPGWNEYVDDKHHAAREAFLSWVCAGRHKYGAEFMIMRRTRARFKLALRYCKQHESMLRADACAKNLADQNYKDFWKSVRTSSNGRCTKFASSVGGFTGEMDIANMWCNHFHKLYNSVPDNGAKQDFYARLGDRVNDLSEQPTYSVTISQVIDACRKQKSGKAVGHDGIAMEAFLYGNLRLCVHIAMLFNICLRVGYLPPSLVRSTIIPLVKCKTGDISDPNNYRAIAISTSLSKILETILVPAMPSDTFYDNHQFGFKHGHSTGICTQTLKNVVNHYTERGSHVFVCFVDLSKAFDQVNYWQLFVKLLSDNVNALVVRLLSFWYSEQLACVKWQNTTSTYFSIGNGVRQGGVLSPRLFCRYIRELLKDIVCTNVGCHIGRISYNVLAYADDLVLCAPAWNALQTLIHVLYKQLQIINMVCNTKKSVCMVFSPTVHCKRISDSFPQFVVGNNVLNFVKQYKYLGHIISDNESDDADILREVKNMYVRTNILARRYKHCSTAVKVLLFKSFCVNMYDTALWRTFTMKTINRLRACYNKCIKYFFGYSRRDSVTLMLLDLNICSFDTLIHNNCIGFKNRLFKCENSLVRNIVAVTDYHA